MKPADKREQVFDLKKYSNKRVLIKFFGGIAVKGIFKGYDQIVNVVLEDPEAVEGLGDVTLCRGPMVCRGPSIVTLELCDS